MKQKEGGEEITNEDTIAVCDKNGLVIGYFSDNNTIMLSTSFQPSPELKAPRENKTERDIICPILERPELDTFDYQKRFVGNLNYVLDIFSARFDKEDELSRRSKTFIQTLKLALNREHETNNKFTVLKMTLTRNAEFLKSDPNLKAFNKEMIFHMHHYNAGVALKSTAIASPKVPQNTAGSNPTLTLQFNAEKKKKKKKKSKKAVIEQHTASDLMAQLPEAAKNIPDIENPDVIKDISTTKKKKKKKKAASMLSAK